MTYASIRYESVRHKESMQVLRLLFYSAQYADAEPT